ncbi:MAG TPA: type II secretion system protein M [Steroidobacteraceae bacterium]|jgi:general secretion pathway protein M|nr:type II secretion system protein M [Steroidobacteraceae bacterium]
MDTLIAWFKAQSPRDQRVAAGAAVILFIILIFAIFIPLDTSVSRAHARVQRKQSDLAWMRAVAPQLAAAGPAVAAPASQRSLIVVIDTSARESGLGSALNSSEPGGAGALRVRLDKAPFDTLVQWLARLSQQNGIRVEVASIDAAGPPGLVNAAITLRTASQD